MEALAKRRDQVPGEVAAFMRLPGPRPEDGGADLARARRDDARRAEGGRRRASSSGRSRGWAPTTEAKILKALAEGQGADEPKRGLLGKGLPVVREVVEALRAHPAAIDVSEAGSTRRRRETFRDLDVIATATDPAALTAHFVGLPWVLEVVAHGDTKATVITKQGLRLDLRVVPPESYGDLLQHFTGSKDHNVALREQAQRDGLSVSEYGVTVVETGEVHTFRDEESLYAFLGYGFIPPELRENGGELEAARRGALPQLVELGDLRGEMHCHSTWSADGKATIEEMARAAAARGYEFLCLTDHSHYLRDGRLEQQWEEIEAVNARRGAVPRPARDRGQHHVEGRASTSPTRRSPSSTGSSRRSTRRSTATRPSGCSRRSTTRTSTASATSPAAGSRSARAPTSISTGSSRAPSRPEPRSRSTASPTGSTCATPTPGWPARRASLIPVNTDAPLDRRARLRRARHRPGAAGVADEGAGAEHAAVGGDREAAVSTFREDGAAALDWVARTSTASASCPVLARVEPGAIRAALPAVAARGAPSRSPPCSATSTRC